MIKETAGIEKFWPLYFEKNESSGNSSNLGKGKSLCFNTLILESFQKNTLIFILAIEF